MITQINQLWATLLPRFRGDSEADVLTVCLAVVEVFKEVTLWIDQHNIALIFKR